MTFILPPKMPNLRVRLSPAETQRFGEILGDRDTISADFSEFDDSAAIELLQLIYEMDEEEAQSYLEKLRAPDLAKVALAD